MLILFTKFLSKYLYFIMNTQIKIKINIYLLSFQIVYQLLSLKIYKNKKYLLRLLSYL